MHIRSDIVTQNGSAHFMIVPRNPDKVTIGMFDRPTPSQNTIWSLMNSGVIESFERWVSRGNRRAA